MIDTILNLMFRCSHRRLTRPVTPVGRPSTETYVVCLDCGKQFAYDTTAMRIGKPIETSHTVGVIPPGHPKPRGSGLKYALLGIPLGLLVGTAMSRKAKPAQKKQEAEKKADAEKTPQEHG